MSAGSGEGAKVLKEKLAVLIPEKKEPSICQDLFFPGDTVVLVIPLDQAAPKGRLILPQQQTIRDILEAGAAAIVIRENEPVSYTHLDVYKRQPCFSRAVPLYFIRKEK